MPALRLRIRVALLSALAVASTALITSLFEPSREGPIRLEPQPPARGAGSSEDRLTCEGESIRPPQSDRRVGRIFVDVRDGGAPDGENGFLELLRIDGRDTTTICAEVVRGRFEVELPNPATTFRFVDLELRGRAARLVDSSQANFRASFVPPLLKAYWPAPQMVRVRDRATKQDLDDVDLYGIADPRFMGVEVPDPAMAQRLLNACETPTMLGEDLPSARSWKGYARAPGYAWKAMYFDSRTTVDRPLDLEPGGDLEIELRGVLAQPDARLRARRVPEGSMVFERALPLDDPRVLIEGIAPGQLIVTVEAGRPFHEPRVLAISSTEVVAHRRSSVTLDVRRDEAPILAPFSGVIELPPNPHTRDFTLVIQRYDLEDAPILIDSKEMNRDLSAVDTMRFRSKLLETGWYRLSIREFAYSELLGIPPEGFDDHRVRLTPPAQVRLRFVDATGTPVTDLLAIEWRRVPSARDSVTRSEPTYVRRKHFDFEIVAPPGAISIAVANPNYRSFTREVRVAPGRSDFTFKLERSCGVLLRLRYAGSHVDWDPSIEPSVIPLGGGGESRLISRLDAKSIRVEVPLPGWFRIRLPEISGFEPIAPFDLLVPEAQFLRHTIELTRAN